MTANTTARINGRRSYLWLLPPSLGMIVVVTAVTIEVSEPYFDRPLARYVNSFDVIANLLLYIPLGVALCRRGWFTVAAAACTLSIFAETAQLFYPDRHPSAIDVGVNTLGAVSGLIGARLVGRRFGFDPRSVRLGAVTGVLSLVGFVALVATAYNGGTASDFSNWDPAYSILVGNEPTGDRPWQGEILGMALTADALEDSDIKALYTAGSRSLSPDAVDHLRPLFVLPVPLSESDRMWARPLLDQPQTRRIFDALTMRNTISILAWFRTPAPGQGPGRIVTFSKDTLFRNFTIVQEANSIGFRLRTTQTDLNAIYPDAETPRFVRADRPQLVAATYDQHVSRVYIDGRLVARLNLAARAWPIPFLADSGLPTLALLTAILLVIAVLSFFTRVTGSYKWVAAIVCGLSATLLLLFIGAPLAVPGFTVWVAPFCLAGGILIAVSTMSRRPTPSRTPDQTSRG